MASYAKLTVSFDVVTDQYTLEALAISQSPFKSSAETGVVSESVLAFDEPVSSF